MVELREGTLFACVSKRKLFCFFVVAILHLAVVLDAFGKVISLRLSVGRRLLRRMRLNRKLPALLRQLADRCVGGEAQTGMVTKVALIINLKTARRLGYLAASAAGTIWSKSSAARASFVLVIIGNLLSVV